MLDRLECDERGLGQTRAGVGWLAHKLSTLWARPSSHIMSRYVERPEAGVASCPARPAICPGLPAHWLSLPLLCPFQAFFSSQVRACLGLFLGRPARRQPGYLFCASHGPYSYSLLPSFLPAARCPVSFTDLPCLTCIHSSACHSCVLPILPYL